MKPTLLFLLALGTFAQSVPPSRPFYRWSVAILAASSAADVASSWRRPETNPVLGANFGGKSVAIKLGLVYRRVAWLNFGIAGALGAVVQHNVSLR